MAAAALHTRYSALYVQSSPAAATLLRLAEATLHIHFSAIPVHFSPVAATLRRLTGAPLPATRLLRLVTVLAAGVNSTSLMGSSSESCGRKQSRLDALQCTESQQAPCLQYVHVQCGCLCTSQYCCWAQVPARTKACGIDKQHQGMQLQQFSKSSEPTCSLMLLCFSKSDRLRLQLTGFAANPCWRSRHTKTFKHATACS